MMRGLLLLAEVAAGAEQVANTTEEIDFTSTSTTITKDSITQKRKRNSTSAAREIKLAKPKFHNRNDSTNRGRFERARCQGFQSGPLTGFRPRIRWLLYCIVKDFVLDVLLGKDDGGARTAIMKMANSNPKPTPDLLSPSASTYHFGRSTGKIVLEDGIEYPLRAAYQAGCQTGLDQSKHTIGPFTAAMQELALIIKKLVHERDPEYYASKDIDCDFNEMDIKMYLTYTGMNGKKKTKLLRKHTDRKHDSSLKQGSPVAICSFGDNKILEFTRAIGTGLDAGSKHSADSFHFTQDNGTVVLLDARDEEGALHPASYYWQHAARLDHPEGISFSIMFRVVEKFVPVDPTTSRLKDTQIFGKPVVWTTPLRDALIPKAEEELRKSEHFKAEKERILRKIVDTVNNYKPSRRANKFEDFKERPLEYKKY
jgi:ribosome modulation factor